MSPGVSLGRRVVGGDCRSFCDAGLMAFLPIHGHGTSLRPPWPMHRRYSHGRDRLWDLSVRSRIECICVPGLKGQFQQPGMQSEEASSPVAPSDQYTHASSRGVAGFAGAVVESSPASSSLISLSSIMIFCQIFLERPFVSCSMSLTAWRTTASDVL